MIDVPEGLLDQDHLEEMLNEPGPPQPVVIVEYRTRVAPWLALIALLVTLTAGSLFAYHQREVQRLRAQAMQDRLLFERMIAATRTEKAVSLPGTAVPTPARASAAVADGIKTQEPVKAPERDASLVATAPAAVPASAASAASSAPASAVSPLLASMAPGHSQSESTGLASRPVEPAKAAATEISAPGAKADSSMALTQLPAGSTPPPSGAALSSAPAPVAAEPVPAASGPGTSTPVPAAPVVAADTARAPAAQQETVVAAEPPLPTKEETERQIREEAARLQRENAVRLVQQEQDLRALRDDERQRFRDQLRKILEVHGSRAGAEIEQLSLQTGRDEDPEMRLRAYRVLATTGISERTKVRKLREVGVPETVVLDYLANGINKDLGARNGPRSPNDVWVRAARRLLFYEPAPTPMPPRTNPPGSSRTALSGAGAITGRADGSSGPLDGRRTVGVPSLR